MQSSQTLKMNTTMNNICNDLELIVHFKASLKHFTYMSTSGNPNEGDLPHLIPPMREVFA